MIQRTLLCVAAIGCLGNTAYAQLGQPQKTAGRRLAPGVLTVVGVESEEAETFSGPRHLVELVSQAPEWTPNFTPENQTLLELAKNSTLRRTVWQFEFSYKPMRLVYLDVADGQGGSRRQPVWYLLYRLRNIGGHLQPTVEKDPFGNDVYGVAPVDHDLQFHPHFTLQIHGEVDGRPASSRMITDRVMPAAVSKIHKIEIRNPAIKLYNSVDISTAAIEVSSEVLDRGLWGVATWPDVDPRTDYFSIYVKGLTNAYGWDDPAGAYTKGSPPGTGREYLFKTLKLNFWRPGDTVREHVREFRLGSPLTDNEAEQARLLKIYRVDEPTDYSWTYLP